MEAADAGRWVATSFIAGSWRAADTDDVNQQNSVLQWPAAVCSSGACHMVPSTPRLAGNRRAFQAAIACEARQDVSGAGFGAHVRVCGQHGGTRARAASRNVGRIACPIRCGPTAAANGCVASPVVALMVGAFVPPWSGGVKTP